MDKEICKPNHSPPPPKVGNFVLFGEKIRDPAVGSIYRKNEIYIRG